MDPSDVIDIFRQVAWPIIIVFFGLFLISPLSRLLDGLAANISRVRKVKIGNVEMSVSELDEAIIEREILKTAILIAVVDEDFDPREMQFLNSRAATMVGNVDSLSSDARRKILYEGINVAAADEVIRSQEYIALKRKAIQFDFSTSELDSMIIERCLLSDVDPPDELRPMFNHLKKEHGLE